MNTLHLNENGFTAVELLLALVVGSIVLVAAYSSYTIIANQHNRVSAISEVQSAGLPTIKLLSRDLRMAGNLAIDRTTLDPVFLSSIQNPITIIDSGNVNCCDEVIVEYDRSDVERVQVHYYTFARPDPPREALFVDINTWNVATDSWDASETRVLVTDYVVDFQVEEPDPAVFPDLFNADAQPLIVDVNLILQGRTRLTRDFIYTKPAFDIGNRPINEDAGIDIIQDRFQIDAFNATLYLRNLAD